MSKVNETSFSISTTSYQSTSNFSENASSDTEMESTWNWDLHQLYLSTLFWQDVDLMTRKTGCPIVLICGTIGNVLTLLVLSRMHSDASTMRLFFRALALSDLGLLYSGLLPYWVDSQFDYSIVDSSQVTCKLITWLKYALGCLSAWLLGTMTIQRAASVVWPHKVRSSCTKRQAYVTIAALVLTTFLMTSNLVYAFHIHQDYRVCTYIDSYIANFVEAWMWIDLLTASLLPFFVLLLSNTLLIWKVLQSVRTAKLRLTGDQGAHQVATREKKLSSMTITLVMLSVTFVLLTGPICGLILHHHYLGNMWYTYSSFLMTVTRLMWYTNSAINFFLYILTGTRFRQELKALLGLCACNSKSGKHSSNNATDTSCTNVKQMSEYTQTSMNRTEF